MARRQISSNPTRLLAAPRLFLAGCAGLFLCLGFLVLPASTGQTATLTATLDRTTIAVGESANLSLTFEGVSPTGYPSLPNFPNVRIEGRGESSYLNLSGGQMVSQKKYTYALLPSQPGQIQIPAMSLNVNGTVVTSQPLILNVLPASQPPPDQPPPAFLKLTAPKTEYYVGEPFQTEVSLYWQNAQDYDMAQLKGDGFSLSQHVPPGKTMVQVGATPYNLMVFKYAATPTRPGSLNLGPAECNIGLLFPIQRNNQRNDPFDFFGPRMQRRPVHLTSDPLLITVLPLPNNTKPASFNGAVGQFSMNVSAGPTTLAVGDPITVKIQITGGGLLDAISLPDQPAWRDFKVYPPTSSVNAQDPLGLNGTKSFEQVVIPQNHEISTLPPVQFSFFDPNSKQYRTLSNAPIALTVSHASQSPTPPPSLTNAADTVEPPVDDIIHIKARPDGVMAWRTPWIRKSSFILLQCVPLAAWLALFLRRKQQESLSNNPKLKRQRLVAQRVRDGLQELETLAQTEQSDPSDDFHATLFRVLQEQLGERLDLPASSITESVIEDKLASRDLDPATLSALHELFQTCNQARYALNQSPQELAALLPKLKDVLHDLQQLKG